MYLTIIVWKILQIYQKQSIYFYTTLSLVRSLISEFQIVDISTIDIEVHRYTIDIGVLPFVAWPTRIPCMPGRITGLTQNLSLQLSGGQLNLRVLLVKSQSQLLPFELVRAPPCLLDINRIYKASQIKTCFRSQNHFLWLKMVYMYMLATNPLFTTDRFKTSNLRD